LTPILGPAEAPPFAAARWVEAGVKRRYGSAWSDSILLRMVAAYYEIGADEGVRPEVGLAQSAKETGYWTFGGDARPDQWNFAGIGTTGGKAGHSWPTLEDGVEGHLRRLRMYADATAPYDLDILLRGLPVRYWGTASNVEELGGKWAPNPDYGGSIVRSYLTPLLSA
jgi:hypothetical protein